MRRSHTCSNRPLSRFRNLDPRHPDRLSATRRMVLDVGARKPIADQAVEQFSREVMPRRHERLGEAVSAGREDHEGAVAVGLCHRRCVL